MAASNLADDFNETASRYLAREVDSPLLLAKYGLMLKFQAKTAEDQTELVSIMADTALLALDARAAPTYRHYLGASDIDSVATLLKTLAAPESAELLSAAIPGRLADVGMSFVRRAEDATDAVDRDKFTSYARLCLEHAERLQSIVDSRLENVSLTKNISPSKRLVLKKDAP